MKWYWKFTIALGFVGMVAMGAAAFAGSDPSSPAPSASASAHGRKAGKLGSRIVHGDLTLNTRNGLVTAKVDGGTVTAVDPAAHTLTIKRADGQSVSFAASDATRVRKDGEKASFAAIKVGDHVLVIQLDRGNGFKVAVIRDKGAGAGTDTPAAVAAL